MKVCKIFFNLYSIQKYDISTNHLVAKLDISSVDINKVMVLNNFNKIKTNLQYVVNHKQGYE